MKNEREIIIIAAMAENRVIGKDNAMPFFIRGNLARFKEMTMGWPCVMGRKTWESLPKKPLQSRLNIIISNTLNQDDLTQNRAESQVRGTEKKEDVFNVKVFNSIAQAMDYCVNYDKIFICGGESIYKQTLRFANKIDLTLVPGQYEGDAFFPEIDDSWAKTETVNFKDFSVDTYIKTNQE